MPRDSLIAVRGLSPIIRDFRKLSRGGLQGPLIEKLRQLGEPVRRGVTLREGFERFGAATIAGVKTIVRQRGVNVEQTKRKSKNVTLRRPNFGALQMRTAFLPSLAENEDQIVAGVEALLDELLIPSGSIFESTKGTTTTRVTGGLL